MFEHCFGLSIFCYHAARPFFLFSFNLVLYSFEVWFGGLVVSMLD